MRPPGEGYLKLGYNQFHSERAAGGPLPMALDYSSETLNLYAELGLPLDMQLVLDLPYVQARNTTTTDVVYNHAALGDMRFELDRRLSDEMPLAFGLELRVPGYRDPMDHAHAEGLRDELLPAFIASFPAIGDPVIDLTVKVLVGRSFHAGRSWATLELGPRLRLGGYTHGIHFATSMGAWLIPNVVGVNLYANAAFNLPGDGIPAKETVYVQASALFEAGSIVPGLGASLHVGSIPFAINAPPGSDFGAALTYRF